VRPTTWLVFVLLLAGSVCWGSEFRQAKGFRNVYFHPNTGRVQLHGEWLMGKFHMDESGTLFNHLGYPVTAFEGSGLYGHNVHYDATAPERYYPHTGQSVMMAKNFTKVGIKDGHIFIDGEQAGTTGGFYLHKGTLFDSHGREVTHVRRNGDGTLFYKYR
jgi:hypothetical protein